MGKGSNTTQTQTSTSPNPQAGAAYSSLLTQAGNVAATPYQAYQGELTAPVNAQQTAGISGINNYANFAQPYIQQAAGLATDASTPLTAAQIQQYQSPYTQSVVNATQNQFNNQNAQQQQQVLSNAAQQGALGGNRVGVTQGIVAGQQQLAQAPVIAGLENQGYQTGLQTALAEQQAQAQGAYSLGALGTAGQNAGLTGAGAQVGAGTLQQGTQQAQDTAAYQQYMQQLAYPFQTTQWLAGVDTGVGSQLGGTSTGSTTAPAPNQTAQYAGLGLAAAGLFLRRGGRVPGFDAGGGIGGTPWSGSSGWVPTIGISAGHGAPNASAPGVSNPNAGQPNPLQTANQALALGKSLKGGFGLGQQSIPDQVGDVNSGFGTQGAGLSAEDVSNFPPEWGAGDSSSIVGGAGDLAVPTFMKRGGGIRGFDSGGDIPLDYNPGIAGFSAQPSNFDMRYAAVDPTLNPATMALAPYQSAGFDNPPPAAERADRSTVAGNPTFDERFNGEPSAAPTQLSTGVPMSVAGSGGFPGQQAPLTGTQAIPSAPASNISAPTRGYADAMTSYDHAIKSIESGGNYQSIGPATNSGDHAYGAHQIMGANIPQWTAEVLGKPLTPQQFLTDPQAQDAVFKAKFGQLVNKYGPEGAARAWFAGEHGMNNPNATDVNGTTVADYSKRFMAALNGKTPQTQVAGLDNAQNDNLPPNAQPTQYRGTADDSQRGPLGKLLSGFGINVSPEARAAILSAGFGMMGNRSPFLGTAIGEAGTQGLNTYYGLKAQEQTQALNQRKVDIEAQKLSQSADTAAKNLALRTEQFKETQTQHGVENMKPVQIGQGILGPIYGVRDPKNGTYRVIDPKTGQVGPVVQPGTPGTTVPPTDTSQTPSSSQIAAADDDATLPAGAQPRSGQVLRNESFLSDLKKQDPGIAALVQGIANYELDPSKVTSMKGGNRERVIGLVMQYDPSFSLPFYASRAAAVKEFNAGGPNSPAGTITSGNTAIQHLGELSDYGEKIGGTGSYGPLNSLINKANAGYKGLENDPDLKRYNSALGRFTEEATKFYRGVGGTESDIQRAISDVSAAQSPQARRAAIAEQARLMQSKINALQDRYKTAMGGPPGWQSAMRQASDDFPIIQQHSAESMKRILDREAQSDSPTTAAAAQPSGGVDPRDAAFLKSNPNAATAIDKKYGQGTAAKLLGPQ